MTLRDEQPEAMTALDAAIARAREVVEPELLDLAQQRITEVVAAGVPSREPRDARESAACAVLDQMLVDVSGLDDETVRTAAAYFPDGGLSDLVMASYLIEARARLDVAAARLLGDPA